MNTTVVSLPRLVGTRATVSAAVVPHREERRLAVSFRDARSVSGSALSEIVLAGTNMATRPLHLLHASASVREAVEDFLHDEPTFREWVSFEEPPAEPEPEAEPTFLVGPSMVGHYSPEEAAALRDRINAWLDENG